MNTLCEIVKYCYDNVFYYIKYNKGVNFFDTAEIYGSGEAER
jgi:predicted oxidoreductase